VRSIRLLILGIALAASAWYVVGIRQARDIAAATGAIAGHGSPGQLAHARSLLNSAAFLNPDQEVQILRGRLALEQGRPEQAQRILAAVIRAEPMNLEGWIWLTGAALGNPPLARAALARIYRLDPLAAPR
jgi:tetratricopeptide (TPR) repeat protein